MNGRVPPHLVVFNAACMGLALSLFLPWGRVAGVDHSGFGFANLLLRLDDLAIVGDLVRPFAVGWYLFALGVPLLWVLHLVRWPPSMSGFWILFVAVILVVVLLLLNAWLYLRAVGYPSIGVVLADASLAVVVASLLWGRRRFTRQDGVVPVWADGTAALSSRT